MNSSCDDDGGSVAMGGGEGGGRGGRRRGAPGLTLMVTRLVLGAPGDDRFRGTFLCLPASVGVGGSMTIDD